jgi:protein involved in polysaccharide export with SLBB domain
MKANTKIMRAILCFLFAVLISATSANAQQRFRDGDIFRMAVGGAPREYTQDFELEYTIDDGAVTIPHIGRMRAVGLSPTSLAGAIEKRLVEEKIFTNPSVVLNPVRAASSLVVGGAVRNPGRHPWAAEMTLTQAIAAASGPSEWAKDQVKLIRAGKAEVYSRKLLKKDPSTDPRVLPNDYVEVQGDL